MAQQMPSFPPSAFRLCFMRCMHVGTFPHHGPLGSFASAMDVMTESRDRVKRHRTAQQSTLSERSGNGKEGGGAKMGGHSACRHDHDGGNQWSEASLLEKVSPKEGCLKTGTGALGQRWDNAGQAGPDDVCGHALPGLPSRFMETTSYFLRPGSSGLSWLSWLSYQVGSPRHPGWNYAGPIQ